MPWHWKKLFKLAKKLKIESFLQFDESAVDFLKFKLCSLQNCFSRNKSHSLN